jgi:hypothetical protein
LARSQQHQCVAMMPAGRSLNARESARACTHTHTRTRARGMETVFSCALEQHSWARRVTPRGATLLSGAFVHDESRRATGDSCPDCLLLFEHHDESPLVTRDDLMRSGAASTSSSGSASRCRASSCATDSSRAASPRAGSGCPSRSIEHGTAWQCETLELVM